MFGAEQILMQRCTDESVFNETAALIQKFKDYYVSQGEAVHKNPAPGNIEGGITTLEDKSLGCVQKAGTAPVTGVIPYGSRIQKKGLHLLESPGNDMVSTTALAAAGAQIILFTTGRGTPLGAPVPTIKISSNSDLYIEKPRWIDFDAGILTGDASMKETAQKLFSLVLETASGSKVCAEKSGYRDIALFKTGVTL